jgi:hypothetical protein
MRQFTDQDLADIQAHFPLEDCLPAPDLDVSPEAARAFEESFDEALSRGPAACIDYALPYPKYLFLEHLSRTRGVMLHGTQLRDLETLLPVRRSRDSREFGDQAALYATQDPLWALFFAVLDRQALQGAIHNGAIQLQGDDGSLLRRYYYCLDAPSLRNYPWKAGAIYLMPREGFEPDPDMDNVRVGSYRLVCTHWILRSSITPLARLPVEPEDFPFLRQVWGYDQAAMDRRLSGGSIAGWPFLGDAEVYPIRPSFHST